MVATLNWAKFRRPLPKDKEDSNGFLFMELFSGFQVFPRSFFFLFPPMLIVGFVHFEDNFVQRKMTIFLIKTFNDLDSKS